jgi:hypothetical protein
MAWKTVSIAFASPSALRIADVRAPSALSTAACFSPSAVRIWDCLMPSAVRIVARRSRSARICFSMASCTVRGGSTDLSSTRLTRMPHRPVASSSTTRSWELMLSREVSVSSSVRPPMTLRSVVTVSCSIAWSGLAISYVAAFGSVTVK